MADDLEPALRNAIATLWMRYRVMPVAQFDDEAVSAILAASAAAAHAPDGGRAGQAPAAAPPGSQPAELPEDQLAELRARWRGELEAEQAAAPPALPDAGDAGPDSETAALRALATNILDAFAKTSGGWTARVKAAQFEQWNAGLGGRA